jgi:chromosome segregation ATPase
MNCFTEDKSRKLSGKFDSARQELGNYLMTDISKLEERAQTALDTITAAINGSGALAAGPEAGGDDMASEIASREARIKEVEGELEELRANLAEREEHLQAVEKRRKDDMAELDEIIEQLEPLIQGRI